MAETSSSSSSSSQNSENSDSFSKEPSWLSTRLFLLFLLIDLGLTITLTTPIIPNLQDSDSVSFDSSYEFYSSLTDLTAMSLLRIIAALVSLFVAYFQHDSIEVRPFELYHRNGEKKSNYEIEEEEIEENLRPWLIRYVSRPSFLCEIMSFSFLILLVVKCLVRLNAELGVYDNKIPHHPVSVTLTTS